MSDKPAANDLGAIWRNQPEEKLKVNLQHFLTRRTQELYSSTRSEIIMSLAAAVFFVIVVAWRFALAQEPLQQSGFAIVIVWVLFSLYWFRDRIWRRAGPSTDAVAAPGVEYYRQELERRRDHLRNAWLWHGPLFLACLIVVVIFAGKSFPEARRLQNAAPLIILLAIWTGAGFRRRYYQAKQIQQEIDEMDSL